MLAEKRGLAVGRQEVVDVVALWDKIRSRGVRGVAEGGAGFIIF